MIDETSRERFFIPEKFLFHVDFRAIASWL